jgi:mannose-6-phosphate isomerase-like protein (cupin superfamily)
MEQITNKPWGCYANLYDNDNYKVKLLWVNKGQSISLQKHEKRSEIWTVVQGHPLIRKGDKSFAIKPSSTIVIEKGQIHRITAEIDDVVILELQQGKCYEEDIIRLEDKYGRS